MSLINCQNIHKYYGDHKVLAGVFMQLNPGEKLGLVGANGSGKTTLLNLIMGEEAADEGQIFLAKGISPGYLSQKPGGLPQATLQDHLNDAVRDLLFLKKELTALEREMALPHLKKEDDALAALVKKYGQIRQLFEDKGGYALEKRQREVSRGLGFNEEDLNRPVAEFSGGEKTRVQLVSLLLQEPDLLLLDEPTNYLDTDALEWLENYLRDWPGALLVVSHDRYFLDRVVTRIIALKGGELKSYRGNYSAYNSQREIQEISDDKAHKKQQAAVKKDLDFIRTASAGERMKKQARSREIRLSKLKPAAGTVKERTMNLDFGYAGRRGQVVLEFKNVSKAFEKTKLFENASFEIKWGDRVALVGPNGAGKTTLLRIVTGEEMQSTGTIKIGNSVKIAYFDQEQEQLKLSGTPLETIINASGLLESEARKHLGRYLFRGDEVFKKNAELSGGEKSRLALAKVALTEGNCLILDEPTNHLDITGVEELEDALADYPGTLLVVSHDRYFIARMATRILEIRDGRVRFFKGTYPEYEEKKAWERENNPPTAQKDEKLISRQEQREKEKKEREKTLALRREKRILEKRISELEEDIHGEEKKAALLEKQLADPDLYKNFDEARMISEEFKSVRERIHVLTEEWEKVLSQLDEFPESDEKS
ncbi:MAG: ABC-F family ATP-binding cassette domain-containing protein [Bacillota bacterium]|nr:ABC-F family ATP-binding cassette domain-containing protein [Bacillota bacterium]